MRDGWTESTLGDVAEWFSGGTPKAGKPEFYENGTIPWVVIADMMKTEIFDTASKITKAGLAEIGGRVAPKGSVLISMYATVGRPGFAHIPVATNQAIAWSVPNEKMILPRFLLLVAQFLESEISSMARGATQRNINRAMLKEFRFKLPPLDEQKRIVDVVSSVDAYIDALQQQAGTAIKARNAVLHELVYAGGDDWTETTVSTLLSRSIGGVWGTEPGTDQEEVTVVRSTEFTKSGILNFATGVPRSIKSSQLSSRALTEGDILLEKSGGGPEQPVGRVVYVQSEIPPRFVCSNFIQLLTPIHQKVSPKFLFLVMWLWHFENKTLEYQAQTTGIRNLRTPDYLEQFIALPPLGEQKRIVEIVSSMDDVIQSTEQAVVDAKNLRSGLLSDLLSGNHEIPASYDSLLGAA